MQKRQFLNLNEGDCIYIYSGGNLGFWCKKANQFENGLLNLAILILLLSKGV